MQVTLCLVICLPFRRPQHFLLRFSSLLFFSIRATYDTPAGELQPTMLMHATKRYTVRKIEPAFFECPAQFYLFF
jgi:hypothetical protein